MLDLIDVPQLHGIDNIVALYTRMQRYAAIVAGNEHTHYGALAQHRYDCRLWAKVSRRQQAIARMIVRLRDAT